MRKLIPIVLVCLCLSCRKQPAAADLTPSVPDGTQVVTLVDGADGFQYQMVKPEQMLGDNVESVAEYVRVGETNGNHYGMRLTHGDMKPYFWRMSP